MKIILVGDYDASVLAHQAIPRAIELSAQALETGAEPVWMHSAEVDLSAIASADALWCVPLSPYADAQAVITAIRFSRENDMPFLGTCAGYQHAVLEYARNVLGFEDADSAEDNPATTMPLIAALKCRLTNDAGRISLEQGSRLADIYQSGRAVETYHCGYGVNPEYLSVFCGREFRFCARDDDGEPRAFELAGNRFYFGTAYQPERSSLQQAAHPLITAFMSAALES